MREKREVITIDSAAHVAVARAQKCLGSLYASFVKIFSTRICFSFVPPYADEDKAKVRYVRD